MLRANSLANRVIRKFSGEYKAPGEARCVSPQHGEEKGQNIIIIRRGIHEYDDICSVHYRVYKSESLDLLDSF